MVAVFSILIIIALIFYIIGSKLDNYQAKNHAKMKSKDRDYQIKKRAEEKNYIFQRINGVEGVLRVDNKSYRTFNTGEIGFGTGSRSTHIEMWVTDEGCFISDIYIAGFSTHASLPRGLRDDDALSYMLSLVDGAVKEGIISESIADRTKKMVDDFFYFAELLEDGLIAQIPDEPDYVWMGRPEH